MSASRSPARPRFFYGWVVVGIVSISMLNIYGIRHSFSAFFPPILDEFGWARGSTALMLSLNLLLYGLLAPIAGAFAARGRPKVMVTFGVILVALSTSGCALAQELWHFYLLFGILMPLGTAFAGVPVLITAVANWFEKRRGMAIGLGYAGGGLSFSMAMYANVLISNLGWRWAFVIMAGTMVAIVIPLIWFFFKDRPDRIVEPDDPPAMGGVATAPAIHATPFGHLDLTEFLRNPRLWLLVLVQMLYMGIAGYMLITHQVIFARDIGYSSLFATSVAGVVGFAIAVGNFFGFLTDRIGREKVHTAVTIVMVLSILLLLLQKDASNPWAFYLYAVGFGFSLGLMAPCVTAGAADLFHGRYFGVVNGLLLAGMGVGGIFGPWLGGYIFDLTGSYTIAFVIAMSAYVLACVSLWIAAPRNAAKLVKQPIQ